MELNLSERALQLIGRGARCRNNINIINRLLAPKSENEDKRRKELVLNIFLFSSAVLFLTAGTINLIRAISGKTSATSYVFLFLFFGFFTFLYCLSRRGFVSLSAKLFLAAYFSFAVFLSLRWSAELPPALLFYVLLIIMSGILISNLFSLSAAILSVGFLSATHFLEEKKVIAPDLSWKTEHWETDDFIALGIIFLIIAAVSWLANHETEKSLKRARKSEALLKKERDSLEITVEEKTKELLAAQMEKMEEVGRLAEFGRLANGFFHDISNPLTALAFGIEKMKKNEDYLNNEEARRSVAGAETAIERIRRFVTAVRKQMAGQETKEEFSPAEETEETLKILAYRALKNKISLTAELDRKIKMFGNPVKFSQMAANLIVNAMDACMQKNEGERKTAVSLARKKGKILLIVNDNGQGIPKEDRAKIFNPFFTTKNFARGTGLGLSLVKRIVEDDFNGEIKIENSVGQGASFIAVLPEKRKES